jgi:arsenical-resistance protein 2
MGRDQGGTIRGSLNLPAQSLYESLPTLYALCSAAEIGLVIWYCGTYSVHGLVSVHWTGCN